MKCADRANANMRLVQIVAKNWPSGRAALAKLPPLIIFIAIANRKSPRTRMVQYDEKTSKA